MNRSVAGGLLREAFHQVLDNRMFRVLAGLLSLPILFTFLVGFREEGVSLFFGLKTWTYEELAAAFGDRVTTDTPQIAMAGTLAGIWIEGIAGSLGVILAIAATAFFVPRMLEKGAADVLFSKPVSRATLYLSRYVAGLIFVALLALVLVVGMYVGFRVASGYDDPGILWAALTLTYSFALVHGVTMLIGVLTRSSSASILLALVFFFGNGCVHGVWLAKEQGREHLARLSSSAAEGEAAEVDVDEVPAFLSKVFLALDALHYALPKTYDADVLTRRLRRRFEVRAPFEAAGGFTLTELPADLERADRQVAVPDAVAALLGAPDLVARGGDEELAVHVRERGTALRASGRERPERRTDAADALAEALAAAGIEPVQRYEAELGHSGSEGTVLGGSSRWPVEVLGWSAEQRAWRAGVVQVGGEIVTVVASAPADEAAGGLLHETLAGASPLSFSEQAEWYEEHLGWDAPLRFNLAFSIGSSLLFTAAVLALGIWRLSCRDF